MSERKNGEQIDSEQKKKIIAALEDAGAKRPCPRCGSSHFSLVDGYFTSVVQEDVGSILLDGQNIPSVIVVCVQCGFLSQHALGALGLLPQENEAAEEEYNG